APHAVVRPSVHVLPTPSRGNLQLLPATHDRPQGSAVEHVLGSLADQGCLVLYDLSIHRVAEGSEAAATELTLAGSLLVGALLASALPLDLGTGHGSEDASNHATNVCRQVDVAGDGGDAHAVLVSEQDQLLQVEHRARHAV